jgi:exodeoxyribonuclease VII small subunit
MPKESESPTPSSRNEASFEQSMERLTSIVSKLEQGELPLEESLRLFEEGVKLSRLAQERLDAAQQRIERLVAVDTQGRPKTAPFESADEAPGSGEDPLL